MNASECSSVKFWLNKACESETTRKPYLSRFEKFCHHFSVDADSLIKKWKTVRYDWQKRQEFLDIWSENVEKYIYNELKHLTPKSKLTITATLLSFFKHHKIILEVEKTKHPYVKFHNRDITREEIQRILDHSNIRNKAFFLMMMESGLRPNTLVQLRYKHIKKDFHNKRVPMKIDAPAEIVKDRVGNRFTFIGEDAFKALKEYLSPRIPLKDDDFVFVRAKHGENRPPTMAAFSGIFGGLVLKLGLDKVKEKKKPRSLRLYCLRKYFRNNIRVRDTAYREFWMGHTFGTDEHYLTRDVEKHRKVYAEAYPSIRIYQPKTELSSEQVEKLEQKLSKEIEAKLREELRREYEQKLREQVREIVLEEMWRSDPHTAEIVEDRIRTDLGVKPDKVDFEVRVSGNERIIYVRGYKKNGKDYDIPDGPIKIKSRISH